MSRSEFRWNKKRKHYAYLFKDIGVLRFNIILSTKPIRFVNGKAKRNIRLFKHPNPVNESIVYVITYVYIDGLDSFGDKIYPWSFDKNDKRIIKRIKRRKVKHK